MIEHQIVQMANEFITADAEYKAASALPLEEYRKVSRSYYALIFKINGMPARKRIWESIHLQQAYADAARFVQDENGSISNGACNLMPLLALLVALVVLVVGFDIPVDLGWLSHTMGF